MSATAILGDCLEKMAGLPDKSIDLFICDLPYGCLNPDRKYGDTEKKKYKTGVIMGHAWDVKLDLSLFWKQVERLIKTPHTPVLMFCSTKFGNDLINSNPKWFRYDLVWAKGRMSSFLDVERNPSKSHEMIYVFSKKGAYYRRIDETDGDKTKCALSVISYKTPTKRSHICQKPEELLEWLMRRYCPDGGTILDPTAGSFSAIRVGKRLGYKCIGIEKDPDFFWKAVKSTLQ